MSAIRLARGFTKARQDHQVLRLLSRVTPTRYSSKPAPARSLTATPIALASPPRSPARPSSSPTTNRAAARSRLSPANPGQIACVIIEAYCGNVGFIMPDAGYLQFLREITSKHGALLLFDEVMTGFRLAKGGVQELEKITPDLTCLGKIIAVACRSVRSAVAPTSWITSHRSVPFTKPARSAGIRSPWPPASPAFACLKNKIPTRASTPSPKTSRRRPRRLPRERPRGAGPQRGSMFSIFFTATPVRDYTTALTGDAKLFAKFFPLSREGRLLAPSAYEAGFVSTRARRPRDRSRCEIFASAIKDL